MAIAYLGLGSNLGNREDNINKACDFLRKNNVSVIQRSTIMETAPVGGPPQDHYLNAVIKIQTPLEPQDLLKSLLMIEQRMGRIRTIKNGPRIIDLDILLYNNLSLQTAQLTIPHPRMLQRAFVMDPLEEIAPNITYRLTHACP